MKVPCLLATTTSSNPLLSCSSPFPSTRHFRERVLLTFSMVILPVTIGIVSRFRTCLRAITFLSLMFGIIGCTASPSVSVRHQPDWVTKTPTSNEYFYAVGVRTASSTLEGGRKEAARDAVEQAINFLSQRVQSQFAMVQSEFTTQVRTELETRVRDELKGDSERVDLRGGLIQDWYFEETSRDRYNVYVLLRYPLAELEKEKVRLARLGAEKRSLIQRLLEEAAEAERKGEIVQALQLYVSAVAAAGEISDPALRLNALGKITGLVQSLDLRPVSGTNQVVEGSEWARELMVAEVMGKSGEKVMPARHVPLVYRWKGVPDHDVCETQTDDRGQASCRLGDVPEAGREHILYTFVDRQRLVSFPSSLRVADRDEIQALLRQLALKRAEFLLVLRGTNKKLRTVVLIREENLGKRLAESYVANALSAKLVEAGYQVMPTREIGINDQDRLAGAIENNQFDSLAPQIHKGVQLVVTGTSSTRPGLGAAGVDVATSRADGSLKVIDLTSGTIMAQTSVTNMSGFGRTEEQAGLNALQRLSGPLADGILEQLRSKGTQPLDKTGGP